MIKIENTEVFGWEGAIRGMRNPKNSWHLSDSVWLIGLDDNEEEIPEFVIGKNDLKLMRTLAQAGPVHGKFLRMINVQVDITAPQHWWAEFDTYKVATVRNSCSKMHKIHVKEFVEDDFTHEFIDQVDYAKTTFAVVITTLNMLRNAFNKTQDRIYWRAMLDLLPTGYNMKATVQLNYEVLRGMRHYRKHHKMVEWHTWCDWIDSLPYYVEILGSDDGE
jgi:hypothetical protein